MMYRSLLSMDKEVTQQLKGLAIISVILGHLTLMNFISLPSVFKYAGAWGVSLFLVLSGFGLTKSYLSNGLNVMTFVRKRLFTMMLPYCLVTFTWISIDSIQGSNYSWQLIILSMLGIDLWHSIDPTMWFVTFMLAWYSVFLIAFRLPLSNPLKVVLLFCFSIVFYTLKPVHPASAPYIFEFPIGVFLGFLPIDWLNKVKPKSTLVPILITFCIFALSSNKAGEGKLFYLLADFSFVLLAFVILNLAQALNLKPILTFIGSLSFELYLLEAVFLFKYRIITLFGPRWIGLLMYICIIVALSLSLAKVTKFLSTRINQTTKAPAYLR